MGKQKYRVNSHMFKGANESGYTYEITFNQSLQHTGKIKGIEDGLNKYDKDELKKYVIMDFKGLLHSLKIFFRETFKLK